MRNYEIMFIVNPNATEDEIDKIQVVTAREVDPALAVHLRSRERAEAARPPRIR